MAATLVLLVILLPWLGALVVWAVKPHPLKHWLAVAFSGLAGPIALPFPTEPLAVRGVLVATDKLVAAAAAALAVALTTWFFRGSRVGLALRAIADDQQIALSMGIDVHRSLAFTWAVVGVLYLFFAFAYFVLV